ncbi:MAG: hypothetical protein ACXVA7_21500 [Isosphaeraceae bacterium]
MMDDFSVSPFRRIITLAFTIACCCVLSTKTLAGELGKAALSEKSIEVLGGRLTVRMPQGAKKEARLFDILSAPESEEHETRIAYDAGQERLVLIVHENFAFAGDDFEKDVREWVAEWRGKYRIEPIQLLTKGLRVISVIPLNAPDHSRSDDATFVEGTCVRSGDQTIQSLDVYLNAAAEKDLEGCRTIGHRILLSVAPGKKRLRLAAGERRLAFSNDLEISIMVPRNTAVTKQVGPDFLVQRLIVLGRLGADSGRIGIYLGVHPDFEAGAIRGDGTIFGKRVEWHSLPHGEGLQTLCKPPIPVDLPLMAHVWVQAPNDAQLSVMKQAAESMKLVKPQEPRPRS